MTEEMLQITKEIELISVTKNAHKWPRKRPIPTVLNNEE